MFRGSGLATFREVPVLRVENISCTLKMQGLDKPLNKLNNWFDICKQKHGHVDFWWFLIHMWLMRLFFYDSTEIKHYFRFFGNDFFGKDPIWLTCFNWVETTTYIRKWLKILYPTRPKSTVNCAPGPHELRVVGLESWWQLGDGGCHRSNEATDSWTLMGAHISFECKPDVFTNLVAHSKKLRFLGFRW